MQTFGRAQRSTAKLMMEHTARARQRSDLGGGLEVKGQVGLAVPRQDLRGGPGVRDAQGVMAQVDRETQIGQDSQEKADQDQKSRSMGLRPTHHALILHMTCQRMQAHLSEDPCCLHHIQLPL